MSEVGILPTVNRWDEALALSMLDPHDSLSHPAGVSDVQAESATRLDPDQFTNFVVCLLSVILVADLTWTVLICIVNSKS